MSICWVWRSGSFTASHWLLSPDDPFFTNASICFKLCCSPPHSCPLHLPLHPTPNVRTNISAKPLFNIGCSAIRHLACISTATPSPSLFCNCALPNLWTQWDIVFVYTNRLDPNSFSWVKSSCSHSIASRVHVSVELEAIAEGFL